MSLIEQMGPSFMNIFMMPPLAPDMFDWFVSPFAQYQRTKFTWRAQDLMEEIRNNHGADLGAEGFQARPDVSEASARMQAAQDARSAELDAGNDDYDPDTDPDLQGFDRLPPP